MGELDEIQRIRSEADLLHSSDAVETAIDRMAEEITHCLYDTNPLILCVMNGGVVITGKLLLRLQFPLTMDCLFISRYQSTTQGGDIEWRYKPREAIRDRTVIIIDDVLDEGITLAAIDLFCLNEGAKSIYSAVLIDKQMSKKKPIQADFVGLQTENRYLFGYGMDYKGYLRNEAGIFACKNT